MAPLNLFQCHYSPYHPQPKFMFIIHRSMGALEAGHDAAISCLLTPGSLLQQYDVMKNKVSCIEPEDEAFVVGLVMCTATAKNDTTTQAENRLLIFCGVVSATITVADRSNFPT